MPQDVAIDLPKGWKGTLVIPTGVDLSFITDPNTELKLFVRKGDLTVIEVFGGGLVVATPTTDGKIEWDVSASVLVPPTPILTNLDVTSEWAVIPAYLKATEWFEGRPSSRFVVTEQFETEETGMEQLVPIGTKTGGWGQAVPSGAQHLTVDEGMVTPDTTDYVRSAQENQVEEYTLGTLTGLGKIERLKWAWHSRSEAQQGAPAFQVDIFLDGQAVVPSTKIDAEQWPTYASFQVEWLSPVFLAPFVGLTGQQWNDATERTMRLTHLNEGGNSPAGPYAQEL
ncbi:MAG: hypothetical protein IH969_09600 [Candidatus Krumholzibacteriota bacterium]|nr:hypothetical protein [Candidatus Krumholzibacteriota bacterium]